MLCDIASILKNEPLHCPFTNVALLPHGTLLPVDGLHVWEGFLIQAPHAGGSGGQGERDHPQASRQRHLNLRKLMDRSTTERARAWASL